MGSDTENKRFKCLENCGKCCIGPGVAFLSEADIQRLERFLRRPRSEFVERAHFTGTRHGDGEFNYLSKAGVTAEAPTGDRCSFLRGTKCGIYEARPTQCRSFPFWPENLKKENWDALKVNYCPGINEGPVVLKGIEEITVRVQTECDYAIRNP